MAKLALTLTLFTALFLLANADSVSLHDPSITLPEPDSKKTILLPSEKPESEPATVVELEHNEDAETENETTAEVVDDEEEEEEKPEWRFAFRDLRPVFPRDADHKMTFVLRHHHHHRCRHPRPRPHYQMLFRQFDVERPETEVGETERSYGNDMLVADPAMEKGFVETEGSLENDMLVADPEMEKRFDETALEQDLTEIHVGGDGGRRHAPWRWVGLHFGDRPRFPDHEHGPHHHHHHHHQHEEDKDGPGKRPIGLGRREEQNGGGLVKRFRKFLHKIEF